MQLYELRINDKKDESKIFWCSSAEEVERVTREQIKQGAKSFCKEEYNTPIEMLAMALSALNPRNKKYIKTPHRKPSKTFKNNIAQAQCIEVKSEEQK